jgi:hypothetical protein
MTRRFFAYFSAPPFQLSTRSQPKWVPAKGCDAQNLALAEAAVIAGFRARDPGRS